MAAVRSRTLWGLVISSLCVAALARTDGLGEIDWKDPLNADATCC